MNQNSEVVFGLHTAYLDFFLRRGRNLAVLSVFDRSQQVVKAFCASLNLSGGGTLYVKQNNQHYDFFSMTKFNVFISPVTVGKEKLYHALMINNDIGKSLLISTESRKGIDFYNYLMGAFDMPLLDWWGEALITDALQSKTINGDNVETECIMGPFTKVMEIELQGNKISDLVIYDLSIYGIENLRKSIKALFVKNEIYISPNKQLPMEVSSMDDYFKKYGHTLVENLEKIINPLTELNGEITSLTLRNMRLYPQQAAMVNGVLKRLKSSRYAILNEGMGVGKTCQSAAICEGYFVEKYLRNNPSTNLQEVYSQRTTIKYRNIVMCPGHMVEKWAAEIAREVPFAKVHIMSDFSQLLALRKRGPERTEREFWVVSKDFAKLSYMHHPTPIKMGYSRPVPLKECNNCMEIFFTPGKQCPHCGEIGYHKVPEVYKTDGMICPDCGEVLLENKVQKMENEVSGLMPEDFAQQAGRNQNCFYCGSILWQPFVKNIDQVNLFSPKIRKKTWYRATHYANKACKAVKSVWVHRRFESRYFESVDEVPLKVKPDMTGVRKYSPALFIKRYMKGFFDFAVFDECHLYKGGGTGQGNAMDALIKSSKKQLALTGTIVGGMAEHLFYLMYRLDPAKMIKLGFKWDHVTRFSEIYGTVEKVYEFHEKKEAGYSNVMCRGRQLRAPRAKPGVSPRVFTDFLIECAVFLDLSDMSSHLPALKERVITVPLDTENDDVLNMFYEYNRVIKKLQQQSRKRGGKGLLGKMLQFSLSFLDKPFGEEVVINPKTGDVVVHIEQYPQLWENGLMPKERKLIELVQQELSEGRKCFVFAEYTSSIDTCVTGRLKLILERELGIKVAILEASSPEPLKREAWIHEQAEKNNVDVVITNPRCVETGLDFCWDKDGVRYNFPTLIFYQIGYSLFTIWQASRRSYRLIQRDECRTYYMAYEGTIQQVVIRLIAEKLVATSSIQGKFSVEGLSSMAKGVDTKVVIAQALAAADFSSKNDLQGMFDVLAAEREDDSMSGCKQMATLTELIGAELLEQLDEAEREPDMEDILMGILEEEALFLFSDPVVSSIAEAPQMIYQKSVNIMDLFR